MKLVRNTIAESLVLLLLLLAYSLPASAVSLLLPAVQAAEEAAHPHSSETLKVTIDSLGTFEANGNGILPLLSFGLPPTGFDAASAGSTGTFDTEILSMDLRGTVPYVAGGDFFDIVIALHSSDPVDPGSMAFTALDVASDDSAANGEFRAAFNFIVEVSLINRDDRNDVTTFLHEDMLLLAGLWHSRGNRLVFDSPIAASGMIQGDLRVVPLPAGIYLFMSGLFAVGIFRRRRRAVCR